MSDKNLQEEEKDIHSEDKTPSDQTSKASPLAEEAIPLVEKAESKISKTDEAAAVNAEKETETEELPKEEVTTKASKKPIEEEEDHHEDEEEVASSEDEEHDEEDHEEIDYHSLSKKELVVEFKKLLDNKPVQSIKNAVEEIRTEFNAKFAEELEEKKEEFLADGGNIIDFHYSTPLKKEFSSLYFDYKEKRNNYYKNLKKDLQANLETRLELIEELKGLLNVEENINTTYKHFKDIQDRWHVAGPIPRDKYNIVWNTYRHHVENFYDFLHLNREFRDLDFKHNLEQKLKIIARAEELSQEPDLNKAFRELQMLHKMWKEDVGPVSKEIREEVWDKFSEATKVIHDKRQSFLDEMESVFEENFEAKKALVEQINEVTAGTKANHRAWQNAIKKVQELRDKYFEIGKVPRGKNKEIWNIFKEATRDFNHTKNSFYKNQKKQQYENLERKMELVKIAEENKDSEDFEVITPLMKKIQNDWKSIGHVPRKHSDKIWKQFKDACNHYFGRLHAQKDEENKEEVEHLKAKEALLKEVTEMKLSGDNKADLKVLKEKITAWKVIGRVPYNKKNIDKKFNQLLDDLFSKLKVSKKEAELIRFENKVSSMISQDNDRQLQSEKFFISKKINEIKDEIRQLENNLGFFQHTDIKNPLVQEVHKNIDRHKEQLDVWKAKMKKLKTMERE